MKINEVLFVAWVLVVFYVTSSLYQLSVETFVVTREPWQERLVSSNFRYAFSLFFLLLILLWHGLAYAYMQGKRITSPFFTYKSLVIPPIIALSLVCLLPLSWNFQSQTWLAFVSLLVFWLAISGDISNHVGKYISSSEWFRSKILRVEYQAQNFLFNGLKGSAGLVIFHLAILLLLLGRFVTH